MARFRMYPTGEQERQMLLHCAHARYVWTRRENEWLRADRPARAVRPHQ
ncbi:helix-turn-helix domain-containing protein [Streptomyces sp. SS7]